MGYNSSFEAEMRRYERDQATASVARLVTHQQLNASIEQAPPRRRHMRRADDHKPKRKPLYRRRWFILLALTAICSYHFVTNGHLQSIYNLRDNVKAATGIDMLAADTYSGLMQPRPLNDPPPLGVAINPAQRAYTASTEGSAFTMEYIEQETRKLNEMATEFDKQFKAQ